MTWTDNRFLYEGGIGRGPRHKAISMTASSLERSGYRYEVPLPQHNRTHDPPDGYITITTSGSALACNLA